MQTLPRPLLAVLLAFVVSSPALAGENDRLRGGGRSSSNTADGPSIARHGSSSGRSGGHSSSGGDGCAAACDFVATCLDLVNACSLCTEAMAGPPQPVVHTAGAPLPPDEEIRAGLMLSLGRPLTEAVTLTPHLDAYLDLPMQGHLAFRFNVDHTSLLQQQADTTWDHLPLTGLRVGLAWPFPHWSLAMVGGLRLLDKGVVESQYDVALDAGLQFTVDQDAWFLDLGLYGLAFGEATDETSQTTSSGYVAAELTARGGVASGPWRLGLGWRHLEFFPENDPESVTYTGPEVTVGLRF